MNEESAMPIPRHEPHQRLQILTVKRPRCPRCGGIALKKYRSVHDQGDKSGVAWVLCKGARCGHRFKLLLE